MLAQKERKKAFACAFVQTALLMPHWLWIEEVSYTKVWWNIKSESSTWHITLKYGPQGKERLQKPALQYQFINTAEGLCESHAAHWPHQDNQAQVELGREKNSTLAVETLQPKQVAGSRQYLQSGKQGSPYSCLLSSPSPLQDAQVPWGTDKHPACRNTSFFSQRETEAQHFTVYLFSSVVFMLLSPALEITLISRSDLLCLFSTLLIPSLSHALWPQATKFWWETLILSPLPTWHHNQLSPWNNSSTLSAEQTEELLAPSNDLTGKF